MIDLTYTNILELIKPYKLEKRSESAAMLVWYLVNYYRLDELEATDCVCDQSGDKGIDGIYVNESTGTIDVFQSKISQKHTSSVGDKMLREFAGTLTQLSSVESLDNLIKTAGDVQVANLAQRLDLRSKIGEYPVRGIFVANLNLDRNGEAFLNSSPHIRFVGSSEMQDSYISDARDSVQAGIATFDIFGLSVTDYAVDAETTAAIAPVLATDLVKLSGIADQSLFSANVRASLGQTAVNKGISASIKDPKLHKAFPLFHNGITVLAKSVTHDERKLTVEDYYVVNGCQSLNALYKERAWLSDDLRILTKFIQVKAGSALAALITTNSNTQNGVKARDFKSNHPIQSRLQNEFRQDYAGQYAYEVKRGEPVDDGIPISNEDAGLLITAFELEEPWTTHRKYQVFDERYSQIFGKPDVSADKIVFLYEIAEVLADNLRSVQNELIGKYVLTKYLMLLAVKRVLEADETGEDMIRNPGNYVRKPEARERFVRTISQLVGGLIIDLNLETQELPDDFDYRGKLRDKDYVLSLIKNLRGSYLKDLKRDKAFSVKDLWNESKALK